MSDDFQPLFQGLYDASQALLAANQALITANLQLVKLGDILTAATQATQHARDEHEDLRDTVHRLEGLIEELIRRQNGGNDK